jgi:7-cyano-7-deazaguanine synthase in queuosine biosynthesis
MPRFTLRLSAADDVPAVEATSSFYWLNDQRSSFTTGVGPNLEQLGAVPPLNVDVVRIALTALSADRSVLREGRGSNWNQRQIELEIPVSDSAAWSSVADELARVLGFLSGDRWTLSFTQQEPAATTTAATETGVAPRRVVLLSGGADSAIGGLYSRRLLAESEHHVMLSHYTNTVLAPIQRHIAAELARLVPGPSQQHLVVHLGRRSEGIDGTPYPSEPTTRSRSLLFLALGLAVAAIHKVPLWIPENGFASINPPLGPERLGSLSTRTTHPKFLQDLATVLAKVGAHAVIENPFAHTTKGEMYSQVVDLVGPVEASAFLSATHSCALSGQWTQGISPGRPCGVCFGCVLRRASFVASGVTDRSNYIAPNSEPAVKKWLDSKSVEQPVRSFIQRGIRMRDLAALSLPTDYTLRDAFDLCQRGIQELRSLYP